MELENYITVLKLKISEFDVTEILKLIAGALLQISLRHESPLLTGLYSPQRQLFYLASLRLQSTSEGTKFQPTQKEWDEIKELLMKIELCYFESIGFPKKGDETSQEIEQINIALPTFMNYYFNGSLAYQEQQLERIKRIFYPFDKPIKDELSVNVEELLRVCLEQKFCNYLILERMIWLLANKIQVAELSTVFS